MPRTLSAGHPGHLSADTPDGHPGPLGPVSGVRSVADETRAIAGNTPDEYTALRVGFAAWHLDPDREPATQKEWAALHGVSEFTVSRWKSHPEVVAYLGEWRSRLRPELGRVVANLIHTATARNDMASVQAARVLIELYGELEPVTVEHRVSLMDYVRGRFDRPKDSAPLALPGGEGGR